MIWLSWGKRSSPMSEKSSFMQRTISKPDAIIQFLRPRLGGQVQQTLDVFDRMVTECETLTKLGIKLQPGANKGESFYVTPDDLKDNLDEYGELEQFARLGRMFLNTMGYESPRRATPITGEGTVPVGKQVDVMPITSTLPGSEPVTGVLVGPKKK